MHCSKSAWKREWSGKKNSKFWFYGNIMYFQNVIINQINVILKQMWLSSCNWDTTLKYEGPMQGKLMSCYCLHWKWGKKPILSALTHMLIL